MWEMRKFSLLRLNIQNAELKLIKIIVSDSAKIC